MRVQSPNEVFSALRRLPNFLYFSSPLWYTYPKDDRQLLRQKEESNMEFTQSQIIAYGELFARFTPCQTAQGETLFRRSLGGSPAQVACAASRLGARASFWGKIGKDPLGAELRDTLAAQGVATNQLLLSPEAPSSLVFDDGAGGRQFYRGGCGDAQARLEEFNLTALTPGSFFYFTSSMAAGGEARETGFQLAEFARRQKGIVAFSPCLCPELWETLEQMKAQCRRALELSDIVIASAEDLSLLMDGLPLEQAAAAAMREYHPKILLAPMGREGCLVRSVFGDLQLPGLGEQMGEVFTGAFLSRLGSNGKPLIQCGVGDIASCVLFAGAAEALAAEGDGKAPSLEETEKFLRRHLI